MNPIDTLKALRVALDLAVVRLESDGHPTTEAARASVQSILDAAGETISSESADERRRRLARERKRRQRDRHASNVTQPSVTQRDMSVTEQRDMSRCSVTGGVGGVVSESKALFEEKPQETKAKGPETPVTLHARESVTERDTSVTVTRRGKRDTQRDSVTVTIPLTHQIPEFERAWNDWVAHCQTVRSGTKRFTQKAAELHMRLLSQVEPSVGVRAIEAAISSGWLKPDPEYLKPKHGSGTSPSPRLSPVEQARAARAAATDWSAYQ